VDGDARQGVRRPTPCDRLFTQETQKILFGVQRSHQAIFQWVNRVADSVPNPPEAKPKQVDVNETAVKINRERT